MEHFPLPCGQAPPGVPQHETFGHLGHLQQVAAFEAFHVLSVAVVPVGVHLHLKVGNLSQDTLRLIPAEDRANADLPTTLRGDHHQHIPQGQLQAVIVPQDAIDFPRHNLVHNSRAMHGVDDLISYPEH